MTLRDTQHNIYKQFRNVIRFVHYKNVVFTEITASDIVPSVLASCRIYSYGFRVMGTYCKFLHHICCISDEEMLYNAMVLPYFNYCSMTWATADQKHLDVLERLQKRAGRMVLGVPSRTSRRDVFDKLKWTNLRTKWKINRCLVVHRYLNSNVPEYLCNHFTRSDHKNNTRTSTSGIVNIPALRTVQGQRSFGYTGSKDYNSLPVNLKLIKEYNYYKIHNVDQT